jgi:uncharacterized protein YbcC (UPF0753/DUF2309 family)/MFS superfamily sulfate permease-like transporter
VNQQNSTLPTPKDWLAGLKENFVPDLTAGFVVFLLALPLSLGIAKASDFPSVMGLVSAIIGGLLATFLTGSKLTIKGPAAGLIVIVAGAVAEFGGGTTGWQLTLGVMVVAGLLQIAFGLLKFGKFVDFFPLAAVHGMLAAIGLIIIAKQLPVLLNVDPGLMKGKGPLELFASIPEFFSNLDPKVSIIGGISLAIMLGWGFVKHRILKQIPAPLLVLLFAIPAGIYYNLAASPSYTLVKVGNLVEQVGYQADFSGISMLGVFIKYVIMVALVGSLESLLTVKAIDQLDPWKRKSDPNKDIIAVGVANTFAAFIGGIPMISEVARSSANVAQGGRTRWANFFHGIFLLGFALLAYPLLEMIPNAALAAMLITVGIKLAHPKEFLHTYQIGPEQLAVFVTTVFFTLFEDLLVGIAAGIALKIIIHLFRGASFKSLFRSNTQMNDDGENVTLTMGEAALFTNYLGLKKILDKVPEGRQVRVLLSNTRLIDHSVMENLHHFEEDYARSGGHVTLVGLEGMRSVSSHPLAARVMNSKMSQVPLAATTSTTSGHFDEAHVLHELAHYLPGQLALKDFVHHNSLHSFQEEEFFTGIFKASRIFGIQATFNLNEYRKLYAQGRIRPEILKRVTEEQKGAKNADAWLVRLLEGKYNQPYNPKVGRLRAGWKENHIIDLDNQVQPILFRILASYLDQGIALWHFPFEDQGLISAVRKLEENSFTSFFRSKRAKQLLSAEDLSLKKLLDLVVGQPAFYENYLFDQQFAHKGWSGFVAAVEGTPDTLLYQKKVSLHDLLLLELLLEVDALDTVLGSKWQPLAAGRTDTPENYFADDSASEREEVLKLWQCAFEMDYYDDVLSGLDQLAKKPQLERPVAPSFQSLFCIDDREDSLRRHLEEVDPNCQTLGAPGYYGAAIYFQPFGGKFYEKNCPAPVTPRHLIKEVAVTTTRSRGHFHDNRSHTIFRGFLATLSLGLWASVRLILDQFRPQMRPDIADAFSHMDPAGELLIENVDPNQKENGLQVGYTVPEMADVVAGILTSIGLTDNFAPLVYVVAHGSSSANNPHHGAHDCGACSGRPGAINARVFAFMANHPEVRLLLQKRSLHLPAGLQFIGGMHDTASDEIRWYDEQILTAESASLHRKHVATFETALDLNARERSRRFASIDHTRDIKKVRRDIKNRSVSYFEPRPELGHGTNALCYVGNRARMKNLFLDRRAFLQSYDYLQDPDGTVLTKVMAPLPIVCGGINLEYYFSRMDIEKMGSGTKLPHNVMGLFGVANSSDGDLRTGLPLQMIENHDPVRLLMIVEQRPEILMKVIKADRAIYDWFDKGWIHLVALSPDDWNCYRFNNGQFERYKPLKEVTNTKDIQGVIVKAPEMTTNHILDATKENIPVHVFDTL